MASRDIPHRQQSTGEDFPGEFRPGPSHRFSIRMCLTKPARHATEKKITQEEREES